MIYKAPDHNTFKNDIFSTYNQTMKPLKEEIELNTVVDKVELISNKVTLGQFITQGLCCLSLTWSSQLMLDNVFKPSIILLCT